MCGRFALHHSTEEVADLFAVDHVAAGILPRYNIAPSQPAHVVVQHDLRTLEAFRWGLVPFWAKDASIGNRLINARAESLADKPAFRAAFRRRRCVLPASGFYEWRSAGGKARVPLYIHRRDGAPLAFAGLWEEWQSPDGELLHSTTIVTTAANRFMAPIHGRMPAILPPRAQQEWLGAPPEEPQAAAQLLALLQPYPADDLTAHVVSRQVNSPAHDAPDCIQPVQLGLDL